MPYKVYHEKRDGKSAYCVHKKNPDGSKGALINGGCHGTPEEARQQQAALYANENKELTPLDTIIVDGETGEPITMEQDESESKEQDEEATEKYYDSEPSHYVGGGVYSFAELEEQRAQQERIDELTSIMGDFRGLVDNVIYSPPLYLEEDRVKALDDLYDEFKARVTENLAKAPDAENKESTEKADWTTAYKNSLPDSSFLYIEPGGKKDGEGKTVPRSYRHLPVKDKNGKPDAAHIRAAINRANQVKTHGGGTISPALAKRLMARARAMLKRVKKEDGSIGLVEKTFDFIREVLNITKEKETPRDDSILSVWKEADGSYGWLISYSNKYLDDDSPPDILSSDAHRKFVELTDKKEAPYPEFWLWHVPEWKIGYAEALAYDETGFPIAMGKFDKESNEIAEWLSTQEDFGVSHGMYNKDIKRDPDDPSVIIEYKSYEISALPNVRAANKLGSIFVLSKEKEDAMAIPTEKRAELLKRGLPEDILSALERRNKLNAEQAEAEGRKSKEETPETTEEQPVPETEVEGQEEQTPEEENVPEEDTDKSQSVDQSQFPTREEVAEAIATVLEPQIKGLQDTVAELTGQLKELKETEEARIKELLSTTPRDSLASVMMRRFESSSKSTSTVVPKGDDILKKKPKETKANKPVTGLRFIDKMITPEEDAADEQ